MRVDLVELSRLAGGVNGDILNSGRRLCNLGSIDDEVHVAHFGSASAAYASRPGHIEAREYMPDLRRLTTAFTCRAGQGTLCLENRDAGPVKCNAWFCADTALHRRWRPCSTLTRQIDTDR